MDTDRGEVARRRPAGLNRALLPLVPAVVTLAVMLYQIGRPSLWRDEASTLSDANRSIPQLFALLGHIDAVHGLYYLCMCLLVKVAGTSATVLRIPSAVAMAVAAGFITLLGSKLASARAGLFAGLLFAALPTISWYGQDARPYAWVLALATMTSYLLVQVLAAQGRARRRWLIGYAVGMAVTGLAHPFALLLIPAHGVTLALWIRRSSQTHAGRSATGEYGAPSGPSPLQQPDQAAKQSLVAGWLVAVVAAALVVSPVAVIADRQPGAGWIRAGGWSAFIWMSRLIGPPHTFYAVVGCTAAGVLAPLLLSRRHLPTAWPAPLAELSLPWMIAPPAILLLASLVHPYFVPRYILFCVPAAALLGGAALAALGRVLGPLALALIVVVALPVQISERGPTGHYDNLRLISQVIGQNARPNDAIIFGSAPIRKIAIAYPAGFKSVHDISLLQTPLQSATPAGTNERVSVMAQRLAGATRVWIITRLGSPTTVPKPWRYGFTLARSWRITRYVIDLYVRP